MAKAVRDPLLPLTHYQNLGKTQPKEKNPFVPWILITLLILIVGAGIYFLHQEIETLNKESEPSVMLEPTVEETADDEESLTPAPTEVEATEAPSVIPTMPLQSTIAPTEAVLCTQEATQCSDGSWVGRSGPNCEFKCPTP